MFKAVHIVATGFFIGMTATNALAADWIESVKLSQGIQNGAPVEVSANLNGYTGIKTKKTRLNFDMYAKATSGERIVAMRLGAYQKVYFFEYAADNFWYKNFQGRDVGSGSKRTVQISKAYEVPVSKLSWYVDPVQLCKKNLSSQMKKGLSKTQVLSKDWSLNAAAHFELDAVAARKGKAQKGKFTLKNTTSQRSAAPFTVFVKCNAGLKKAP